jgi:hypothetical protein
MLVDTSMPGDPRRRTAIVRQLHAALGLFRGSSRRKAYGRAKAQDVGGECRTGDPHEMDSILAIATRYDLKVVEDAAQGIIASCKGRPPGDGGSQAAQISMGLPAAKRFSSARQRSRCRFEAESALRLRETAAMLHPAAAATQQSLAQQKKLAARQSAGPIHSILAAKIDALVLRNSATTGYSFPMPVESPFGFPIVQRMSARR